MPDLTLTLAIVVALGFSAGALAGFATGLHAVRHAFVRVFDLLDVLTAEAANARARSAEWGVARDA